MSLQWMNKCTHSSCSGFSSSTFPSVATTVCIATSSSSTAAIVAFFTGIGQISYIYTFHSNLSPVWPERKPLALHTKNPKATKLAIKLVLVAACRPHSENTLGFVLVLQWFISREITDYTFKRFVDPFLKSEVLPSMHFVTEVNQFVLKSKLKTNKDSLLLFINDLVNLPPIVGSPINNTHRHVFATSFLWPCSL